MATVLDRMRTELITTGKIRDPRVAGPAEGPPHPMFLEPRDGCPAPGEKKGAEDDSGLMAAAFWTGGPPALRQQGFKRTVVVDVWLRAKKPTLAYAVDVAIFTALHGTTGAGKQGWTMGGLYVIESLQQGQLRRLGADGQAYNFITTYSFEVYDESILT